LLSAAPAFSMGAELATQSGNCMHDVADELAIEDVLSSKLGTRSEKFEASVDQAWNDNTVLVFDWDDTLLCSTAVRNQQWEVEQMMELEIAIETILRTAMSLGETLIVTNGNATWVQDSAQRWLPGLIPILSQLRIVSARALYEDRFPGDPFMWKHAAFEHLLTRERHYPADPGLNLVALGDQFPEIDAARHIGRMIGGSSLVKTIKFREAPSVDEVVGQLSRVEQVLSTIVKDTENQSYGLVLRELPPFIYQLTSTASGWQCVTEAECTHGCVDPITGIKDILGLVA